MQRDWLDNRETQTTGGAGHDSVQWLLQSPEQLWCKWIRELSSRWQRDGGLPPDRVTGMKLLPSLPLRLELLPEIIDMAEESP